MNRLQIATVARKELVDHLRDKRTATMIFLLSVLMGPVILIGFATFLSSVEKKAEAREVFIAGAQHAPQLRNFLARQDITVKDPAAGYRDLIKTGKHEAVLEVPKEFEADFAAGKVTLRLVYDDTRQDTGNVAIGVLRRLVRDFNAEVGTQRLIARGVSPQVLRAVELQDVNLGTPQQRAAQLLFMIPFITLIVCVTGCTAVAIDVTAGERERGSLEPLLLNPVNRLSLVAGKWIAVAAYAIGVVALTMAGYALALQFMPLFRLQSVVSISPMQFLGFGITMLSFAPAMGALQMLIATYGRTFKEAQTYVSYLVTAVSMVPMISIFGQLKDATWQLFVPMLGQLMVITRVLRGDRIDAEHFAIPLLVNALICAAAVVAIARLLRREQIIFGRA
ncbi:MAG TPA: ABC transporter permease subunit [Usitatibacteraceae bacterium]|nr:ABC transporter permease subunit [Usitatibacteraceae bacterium]